MKEMMKPMAANTMNISLGGAATGAGMFTFKKKDGLAMGDCENDKRGPRY
jgi:hypothetical protein